MPVTAGVLAQLGETADSDHADPDFLSVFELLQKKSGRTVDTEGVDTEG